MKLNKVEIKNLYWEWVQENIEDYRWTAYMEPSEVVDIICDIVDRQIGATAVDVVSEE
jgi:hypothetical protein